MSILQKLKKRFENHSHFVEKSFTFCREIIHILSRNHSHFVERSSMKKWLLYSLDYIYII